MEDIRQRPKLLLESVKVARVEVNEGLERDALLPLPVEYVVNEPHAALSEAAEDFVAGGPLPVRRGGR